MALEPKDYKKFTDEMEQYEVSIPSDPVSTGLDVFLEKLSNVNEYIQRVGTIELKALQNENYYKRVYGDVKFAYELRSNKVLSEHKEIRDKRAKDLREAATSAFLEDEAASLLQATHELESAKTFRKMVERKLMRLQDAGDKISRQITVVDYMIKIGQIESAQEKKGTGK